MEQLIVIDCQNDFIDGSLACAHSHEAVAAIIAFANARELRVLYTSDWHSPQNKSFAENGGTWPVHCVAGTEGAALSPAFAKEIRVAENRPSPQTVFRKGKNDDVEEYSAFYGENEDGEALCDLAAEHVYVAGIASEYCVRETALSFLAAGHRVTLLADALGYVDKAAHEKNVEDLREKGVEIMWNSEFGMRN